MLYHNIVWLEKTELNILNQLVKSLEPLITYLIIYSIEIF